MFTFGCALRQGLPGQTSEGQAEHCTNKDMRISPEPLHPLRCWRELWQSESVTNGQGFRKQASPAEAALWKQPKRSTGFHWFTHFFSRDLGH